MLKMLSGLLSATLVIIIRTTKVGEFENPGDGLAIPVSILANLQQPQQMRDPNDGHHAGEANPQTIEATCH